MRSSCDLEKVRLNRDWGWSAYRLGLFSLTPEMVEHIYPNDIHPDLVIKGRATLVPWDIDRKANTVRLRTPKSQVHPLEFPAKPMLGCIGVAPAGDFAPTSGPSGPYGGNLDYNKIGEGATVYLPVYHPGGLLFVGDGHALQADGEPTGTGIETSMDVEFVVELKKGAKLTGPRVETADEIISIGSQPEFASALDNGLKIATSDMVGWLVKDYGMEAWAAHLLIGYQGRYDVVTVAGSMALCLPKNRLPKPANGPVTTSAATGETARRPRPDRVEDENAPQDRRVHPALLRRGTREALDGGLAVRPRILVSSRTGDRAGVEPGRARSRAAWRFACGDVPPGRAQGPAGRDEL